MGGRKRIAIAFRNFGREKESQIIFDAGDRTLHTRITVRFSPEARQEFLAVLTSAGARPDSLKQWGRYFVDIQEFLLHVRRAIILGKPIGVSIRDRRKIRYRLEPSQRRLDLKKTWSIFGT